MTHQQETYHAACQGASLVKAHHRHISKRRTTLPVKVPLLTKHISKQLTTLPVRVPVLSKHTTDTSAMVLIFSACSTWMCCLASFLAHVPCNTTIITIIVTITITITIMRVILVVVVVVVIIIINNNNNNNSNNKSNDNNNNNNNTHNNNNNNNAFQLMSAGQVLSLQSCLSACNITI